MANLLIADDEAIIRQGLMSINWESIGVNVIAAVDNGLETIELLQSELVDILLTDIRMPGMDGLGVAKFIYEQELYTEVILLSGYSDFEYARSAIQYKVMEYILKPSSPEEIIETVKRACKQVNKKHESDLRFKLLEAELGKRQLIMGKDGIILGEAEYSDIAKKMLGYIANNYNQPISLSTLSEELHFSPTYFSKVIKKATGYTFLEILNSMRVQDAADKLRTGTLSFGDICESVSIEDPRYFSQVFKKYFGKTPSEYKKEPNMPVDIKLAYLVKSILGGQL
jgi:Response regulator containing CheY-like receiver domain and AraC-type DNA-binding domain